MVWKQLAIQWKKWIEAQHTPFTKLTQSRSQLKCKGQNYKNPEDNIGENLDNPRWDNNFKFNKGMVHERNN